MEEGRQGTRNSGKWHQDLGGIRFEEERFSRRLLGKIMMNDALLETLRYVAERWWALKLLCVLAK